MSDQVQILCVDDEKNVLKALERIFLDDDFEIMTGNSGDEGLEILDANPEIQVVISDYRMPGMNGVEFLREVFARRPDTVRMVLSGYADTAAVVAAINEGQIYKFIPKPWNDDELRVTVIKAIETFAIHQKNKLLEEELMKQNREMAAINENLERIVNERLADIIIPSHAQSNARSVLQNLPVGVIELMEEGVISQINAEASVMLGCDPDHATGRKMDDLLPDELVAAFRILRDRMEYSGMAKLNDRDLVVKGRRIKGDDGEDIILVLYPGASP